MLSKLFVQALEKVLQVSKKLHKALLVENKCLIFFSSTKLISFLKAKWFVINDKDY